MTFNPFRRTFLGSLPAAFAGLFGLGRARAGEYTQKQFTLDAASAKLRELIDEVGTKDAIILELVRACDQLGCWSDLKGITHSYGDTLDDADVLAMLKGWNATYAEMSEPTAYEYRIVADFADGMGGTIHYPNFNTRSERESKAYFPKYASELPSHGGGTIKLQRAAMGLWETIQRADG